jgi:beta-glucanase (GH16 family)
MTLPPASRLAATSRLEQLTVRRLRTGIIGLVTISTVLLCGGFAAANSGQSGARATAPSHWHQILNESFNRASKPGHFLAAYPKWTSYTAEPDTTHHGWYDDSILSTHNSLLDIHLHSAGGRHLVAAPIPLVGSDGSGQYRGQLYGRYSVRFKADPVKGYKTAWLLWPDDNVWAHGEIDFPEGDLSGNIRGSDHCLGNPEQACLAVSTPAHYTSWHVATITWTPAAVTMTLDGKVVGRSTTSPKVPMHFVLQTETSTTGSIPTNAAAGHVLVDWVTISSYHK